MFFGAPNDLFTIRSVHRQGFRGIVYLIGLTMCVAEGGVWKNYRIAFLGSRIQSSSDQQARRKPLFVGYLQTTSVPLYSITSYVNMWINMCVSYFYFPCVCVCVLFLCEELVQNQSLSALFFTLGNFDVIILWLLLYNILQCVH